MPGFARGGGGTPPLFSYLSGSWYGAGEGAASTVMTPVAVNGIGYYMPLVSQNKAGIQAIGLEISGAGGVGSVVRLGVYSDTGSGQPGALVGDFGTVSGHVVGGTFQSTPTAGLILKAQTLYWVVAVFQGTTTHPQVGAIEGFPRPNAVAAASPSGLGTSSYDQVVGTGALPASATPANVADPSPLIYLQAA